MDKRWLAFSLLALSLGVSSSIKAQAQEPASRYYAQEERGWDKAPAEFREVQRQGYHDGIEGAHKDFDNHRRPDVNNREEYRHPHVHENAREEYREGYRQGYEKGFEHLMNDHDRDHDHDHR